MIVLNANINQLEHSTHIYQLIELELHSALTPDQEKELEEWVRFSADNLSDYKSYKRILIYSSRLAEMKEVDTARDLGEIKERFSSKKRSRSLFDAFQRIAAILIIPLMIYIAWDITNGLKSGKQELATNSTETTIGVRTHIQLSDGTKVWMNSDSKLEYPEKFIGKNRQVKLVGEAYFEVKSDKSHPFYVDLGGYKIKATGTKFDISNYSDSPRMNTFLEHGVVSLVGLKNGIEVKYTQLNEGEQIVLDKKQNQFQVKKGDSRKSLAWIDGKLVFDKDPMPDVANRLGRWFNVDVVVKDAQVNAYIFTATFEKESLEEALNLLSYSSPIKYQIIPGKQRDDRTYSKRQVIISKK